MITKAHRDGHAHFEWQHRTRTGKLVLISTGLTRIPYQGGEALFCVARDITDHKAAEAELQAGRELYQRLVDDIGPNYVVFSNRLDGTTEYLSKGFEHVFGIPPVLDRRWSEAVDWDADSLAEADRIRRQFQAGTLDGADLEMAFTHADGSLRTLALTTHAVRDTAGKYIGSQGIALDITERKRTVEELREAVGQREAAEHFARGIIDALSAHLCVLDENGVILTVNRAWRDFADANPPIPPNYAVGSNYLKHCAGDKVEGQLRAVLTGEQTQFSYEYACHAPARKRWFTARITRFLSNGAIRVVITHENITSRKLAEQALLETKAALEKSNRAHELIALIRHAVIHAVTEEELLRDVCKLIVAHPGFCSAWVGRGIDDSACSIQVIAQTGFEEDCPAQIQ
ncbi:MAG: PAS domain S-box protein, partial [Candidatus Electrothrix sp. AUS1_2]|nr:PAS domain S-box protein [Candidatus Electrothrix sp. AUS1_2]